MEGLFCQGHDIYMESTYHTFRSFLVYLCRVFLSIKVLILSFSDINSISMLVEFIIPNVTLIYFIGFLYLEHLGYSKHKLLFVLTEMINWNCFMYGTIANTSYVEIYVLASVVVTCGVQIECCTKKGSWLVIFKLVFVWFFLPLLLGWKPLPANPTPYMSAIFVLTIMSHIYIRRKQLVNDYIKANEQIARIKLQFYNIIQALPESVIILSANKEVLLLNLACQELFEVHTVEEIKALLSTLEYSSNSRSYTGPGESFYQDILHYLSSENRQIITLGTVIHMGKSLEWRASKSEWDNSSVLILTTRDVSTLIAYERAKAEAQSKTAILRTVSHELRTPTNALISLSESILDAGDMSRENLEKVKIMHISSKLLLCLISDLLDFSKLIADCLSINKCEFALQAYLEEVYSLFLIQCTKKGLEFKLYIDPLIPNTIHTDPNRLRQIIINLISNALKFTIQGTIELRAMITEQANLLIEVSDTGLGIPSEKLNNIFDSFNRTHDLKLNPEGCGLGLHISNILANILGGSSIQVQSRINEGSKFSFEVFTGLNQSICIEGTDEELHESIVGFERPSVTIPRALNTHDSFTYQTAEVIVIDDDEFSRMILKNFLRDAGIQFQEAVHAEDGIEKLIAASGRGWSFKVVIMDCNLPGINGPQAAREIMSLAEERKIMRAPAVVAFTSDDTDENREVCRNSGMCDYLTKPCTKHSLLNVVKKYI
jgi:signal transduction histidine kinase/CheY-like chemotaxis protein